MQDGFNNMKSRESSTFCTDLNNNPKDSIISDIASCMSTIYNNMDELAKYSWTKLDSANPWNASIKGGVSKFLTEFLPQQGTSKERDLMKTISELQKKIQVITIERKESELAVEQLNTRLEQLKQKLNDDCEELYLLAKHPSEDEVLMLERLTQVTKEVEHRTNVIKALEEQEKMLKNNFNCKNKVIMNKSTDEYADYLD